MKNIKKILLLFLGLLSVGLMGAPEISEARKKKYRYIKRAHGLRLLSAGYDMTVGGNGDLALAAAYSWNWKGMVEVGPYGSVGIAVLPNFGLSGWKAGLLAEYNFIKNRGKRKFIPALGLKIGGKSWSDPAFAGTVGPNLAAKFFVAKRTAIMASLGYMLVIPGFSDFQSLGHDISFRLGFAHYFDL